jgi:hypothetical protein
MRRFESYHTSANIKVWYRAPRQEHYEVQRIPSRGALEIGFHSEHSKRERNDDVVAQLVATERKWRRVLGSDVEVGPFIGAQSGSWRRVSEVWGAAHWDADPATAVEAAERLALYIRTLEPLRTT